MIYGQNIPKEEMIEYAKKILKERGYKKKGTRWTKAEGEFTISFYLQGSSYAPGTYYIRPGIFLNAVESDDHYGHFFTQIEQTNVERVMQEFDAFVREWTNRESIKKNVADFLEWDKRNPLSKRQANLVDIQKDPPPTQVLLTAHLHPTLMPYIMENF